MKIALINQAFGRGFGGGERYALDLAIALAQQGWHIHLIATTIDGEADTHPNITTHRLSVPKHPHCFYALRLQDRVEQVLRSQSFDLTYTFMRLAPSGRRFDAMFLGGGSHVRHMQARYPNPLERWFRYVSRPVNLVNLHLEKKLFGSQRPGKIVANSEMAMQHAIELYGLPDDLFTIIRHGVDHDIFNPENRAKYRTAQRQALGLADGDLAVSFVANNWNLKGLTTLIRAAAIARQSPDPANVKILVVGKGKAWPYQQLAKRLGVSDSLILIGPSREVVRYHAAADLFALPTRYDPFAVVTLEAMACGLPAITSRCNGACEMIRQGENGFLLDHPDDARSLANDFLLLRDPALRHRLGQNAIETARPLTHQANAQRTMQVLTELAKKKKPQG